VKGDENRRILLNSGIIPLLFPLVVSSDINVWKKTVSLLSNICYIKSVEDKNLIIICGIFDVFHKKLLEISPFPPQKMISSNYYSISRIFAGIDNLLISNRSGVTSFLKTSLIPVLLHTLHLTISIADAPSDENISNIQLSICSCLSRCMEHSYEDTLLLVEMKVIDYLLNIIEMYINEIKKEKILLSEETVKNISMIFFNTGYYGSKAGSKEEKNRVKKYFDENNRLNTLLDLFKHLISRTLSPIQKDTINCISITICLLLKNENPSLYYGCVLEYVQNLKSSPSPTSGYDFPLVAKNSWDEMLNLDEYHYQIRFTKSLDGVEIKGKTITFTNDYTSRTVFIDKTINSGIMKMFNFFLSFLYLYILFC
jgi:hypothetical protein